MTQRAKSTATTSKSELSGTHVATATATSRSWWLEVQGRVDPKETVMQTNHTNWCCHCISKKDDRLLHGLHQVHPLGTSLRWDTWFQWFEPRLCGDRYGKRSERHVRCVERVDFKVVPAKQKIALQCTRPTEIKGKSSEKEIMRSQTKVKYYPRWQNVKNGVKHCSHRPEQKAITSSM